jgi:hypothetical protein
MAFVAGKRLRRSVELRDCTLGVNYVEWSSSPRLEQLGHLQLNLILAWKRVVSPS